MMNRTAAIAMAIVMTISVCGARLPVRIMSPNPTKTGVVAVEDGLAYLRAMGDAEVSVISVVGAARSGKSFSLNYILDVANDDGFEVGHTDVPLTVGALVMRAPAEVMLGRSQNRTVIFVDTEGLGGGAAPTYDKALAFAALAISDRVVYHMNGYAGIDDVARLFGLASLAEYSEHVGSIKVPGRSLLPEIVWVIQRYDLERSERTPSEGSVLDMILSERENPTDNPHVAEYNATVRAVREMFPSHSIHLIPSAGTEGRNLVGVARKHLRTGYIRAMTELRDDLLGAPGHPPQSARRKVGPSTARQVADFLVDVLPAANLGVAHVGAKIADFLAREALSKAIENVTSEIAAIGVPVESEELAELAADALAKAEAELGSLIPGVSRGSSAAASTYVGTARRCLDELRRAHSGAVELAAHRNHEASDVACTAAAATAIGSATGDEFRKKYGGNIAVFDAAADLAVERYEKDAVGPAREKVGKALRARLSEMRAVVSSDALPRRKAKWAFCAVLTIVAATTGGALMTKLASVASQVKFLSAVFEFMSLASVVTLFGSALVLLISMWSLFDGRSGGFELMTSALSRAGEAIPWN